MSKTHFLVLICENFLNIYEFLLTFRKQNVIGNNTINVCDNTHDVCDNSRCMRSVCYTRKSTLKGRSKRWLASVAFKVLLTYCFL